MRPLAIARFRIWSTIRAATPIFATAAAAPLLALLLESRPNADYILGDDIRMQIFATASLIAWLLHGWIIFGVAQEFGHAKIESNATVHPADLMDSAPIRPRERYFGEFTGVLIASAVIHACCLPVLAAVATLSPLPTIVFVWLEAMTIALMILASAAAAWRRVVGRGGTIGTRFVRTTALFFLLIAFVIMATTEGVAFRDAAVAFVFGPSLRAWSRLMLTINNPFVMLLLFALIYASYLVFFYVSSIRYRAET